MATLLNKYLTDGKPDSPAEAALFAMFNILKNTPKAQAVISDMEITEMARIAEQMNTAVQDALDGFTIPT